MNRIFFNPFTGQFFKLIARRKSRKAPVDTRVEALRAQAKRELPLRLAALAAQHGFTYNKVFIKNNVSNWGSCSSLKNINLNLRLVTLPQELQDYVMLHELCHLRYLNHGKEFHALLESVCPGHRQLAQRMKEYKIK
jgi:predicted metal-dependent hydrolase